MEPLLNIVEIARLLGCSTKTVRRRVDQGLIPVIQEGGPGSRLRFDWHDVISAIKGQGTDQDQEDNGYDAKLSGPLPSWMQNDNR